MPRKLDPDKALKQWQVAGSALPAVAQAVLEAGPEAAVFYADESRIELLPLIRASWHWIGSQIRIPTPGTNDGRTIFGALNIRTGHWSYLMRQSLRKEDFIAFLEHLLVEYPNGRVLLIVDNFSSHKANLVRDWLKANERLSLHFLPTYCSDLNPVERIWLQLKNQVAANRLYVSMDVLIDTVNSFFAKMTLDQALVWASV